MRLPNRVRVEDAPRFELNFFVGLRHTPILPIKSVEQDHKRFALEAAASRQQQQQSAASSKPALQLPGPLSPEEAAKMAQQARGGPRYLVCFPCRNTPGWQIRSFFLLSLPPPQP